MRPNGESLIGFATDLSNFLSFRHRTALEMAMACGKRQRPHRYGPLLDSDSPIIWRPGSRTKVPDGEVREP